MRFSVYIRLFIIMLVVQTYCTYGQETSDYILHIVKAGENARRISVLYNVPVDSIRRWNYLDRNYRVVEGMELIIKYSGVKIQKGITVLHEPDNEADKTYKVKPESEFPIITTKDKTNVSDTIIFNDKLTSDDRLAILPDPLVNMQKSLLPDSLMTPRQPEFLPSNSEPEEKSSGSTFFGIVHYYYHKSNYLFKFVLFLNLVFLVSSITLSVGMLTRRLRKGFVEHKRKECMDRYRDFITDWLYEDPPPSVPASLIKELKDKVSRDVFTSELLSLHNNLIGESAEKLADLFHLAGFKKYSIQKVNNTFWHLKAKGFKELAQMNIKENHMLFKYLNSGNVTLSIEAQLAWIQLNPDDPLSFYDDPSVDLTKWGQLNLLIALRKCGRIPNFGRWLNSASKSVSLFALRMVEIYKQFDNVDLVAHRLDDNDPEIRCEAICTLGKMAVLSQVSVLRQLFQNEELENRTEIVRSLIMMSESSNVPFFEEVLLNETDINLRILAAKGLHSLGDTGNYRLDSIFLEADPVLKKIITHAKDDRI